MVALLNKLNLHTSEWDKIQIISFSIHVILMVLALLAFNVHHSFNVWVVLSLSLIPYHAIAGSITFAVSFYNDTMKVGRYDTNLHPIQEFYKIYTALNITLAVVIGNILLWAIHWIVGLLGTLASVIIITGLVVTFIKVESRRG